MKKSICFCFFFLVTILSVHCQTRDWKDIYIISEFGCNFKFEIKKTQNYYLINYYYNSDKIETKISDTIKSLDDRSSFDVAVKKLLTDTLASGLTGFDASKISALLIKDYIDREKITSLNSRIESLENDMGAFIGVLNLKTKPSEFKKALLIPLYKHNKDYNNNLALRKQKDLNVIIDSVDIAFEKGVIKDIQVRAKLPRMMSDIKDSLFYFSNNRYIPVRNAQDIDFLSCKERNYLTFLYKPDSLLVLDLADIIDFNRKIPYSSGTYIPKDTSICIIPGIENRVKLYKPSISEYFNIRVFSDFLGYDGKSPNGIIQTEAQIDFPLSVGGEKSLLSKVVNHNYNIYHSKFFCINRISPYFKITKIQEKGNRLSIDANQGKKGDLLDLFKYAHLDIGTELNFCGLVTNSKLFTFNFAVGILRTNVGNDSIESNNIDISSIYLNPNINLQFFESNRIDFNLKIGLYSAWQVSTIDSSDLVNAKTGLHNYFYDISNYWAQFQQSINIHPGGKKSNSIFLRATQYVSSNNKYFTFQFGYSTTLRNLLKL